MIQPLSFFTERIGKRIYRNPYPCCVHCDDVAENGLIVHDKQHAGYLYDTQNDFGNEGVILNYRDKK